MRVIRTFIADDHTVIRDGMRALLENTPDIQMVGEASDGRQAVQQVRRLSPDVVVMDLAMPGMNGVDATARICSADSSVNVLILSMHSSTEHVYRALEAGARGYLLKESAGDDVIEAIRTVHRGHRYLDRDITSRVLDDYVLQKRQAGRRSPLELLSTREREILQLVVEGKTSTEIAAVLNLSAKTVETYRSRLMKKLGIRDLPSLVKFAILHGVTSLK